MARMVEEHLCSSAPGPIQWEAFYVKTSMTDLIFLLDSTAQEHSVHYQLNFTFVVIKVTAAIWDHGR